jgi:hypothetical protein
MGPWLDSTGTSSQITFFSPVDQTNCRWFSYYILSQTHHTIIFWNKTHKHVIIIALYIDNYRYIPWTPLIVYLYSVNPKYQKSIKPWSLRWVKPTSPKGWSSFQEEPKLFPPPEDSWQGLGWCRRVYGWWIYMDLYGFMDLYQHKILGFIYSIYEILGIYVDWYHIVT